jgi:hypothetical protein
MEEWLGVVYDWWAKEVRIGGTIAIGIMGLALLSLAARPLWRRLRERQMSKRRQAAWWKAHKVELEDIISDAVEKTVERGELSRAAADYFYKDMYKKGYKGLGFEPSYGKPWWKRPDPPHPKALKAKVRSNIERLQAEREMREAAKMDSLIAKPKS